METVSKIPQGNFTIGTKEIVKKIKIGEIKKIIVAKNCPELLVEKLKSSGSAEVMMFNGDQKELATMLGKPFCVAAVGFER